MLRIINELQLAYGLHKISNDRNFDLGGESPLDYRRRYLKTAGLVNLVNHYIQDFKCKHKGDVSCIAMLFRLAGIPSGLSLPPPKLQSKTTVSTMVSTSTVRSLVPVSRNCANTS